MDVVNIDIVLMRKGIIINEVSYNYEFDDLIMFVYFFFGVFIYYSIKYDVFYF